MLNTNKIKRSFLALTAHETTVFFPDPEGEKTLKEMKGHFITFSGYKKTPRVIRERIPDPKYPNLGYRLVANEIRDLPLPLRGKNLIVSRECLRAVRIIQKRQLLETPGFITWWLTNKKPRIGKKIKGVAFEQIPKKWPELWNFIDHLEMVKEKKRDFYRSLKLYWDRDDLWAPGEQVRRGNEIIAAWQLIHEVEEESVYERFSHHG